MMQFRQALTGDIPQIQEVRLSVRENVLSDPSKVTDQDCEEYINRRGRGWVCIAGERVVGFAIADLRDENIWALFVHPGFEGRGIGSRLHAMMMSWYFGQGKEKVWLSTEPRSRAETFYRRSGWRATGLNPAGELRFELTAAEWQQLQGTVS